MIQKNIKQEETARKEMVQEDTVREETVQDNVLQKKYEVLLRYLKEQGSLAVAFSGGVDSAFLLHAAKEALGDAVIALTAKSGTFPEREHREAIAFCRREGVRQFVVETDEMAIEGFASNPVNRCYICKKQLFTQMMEKANEMGIALIAEGSNMDDIGDYRPGMQAIKELGVLSPLKKAELTKAQIRALSQQMGLPTWNKQSFACLASRFVYGETITGKKLKMVELAEQFLLDLGFTQLRVRIHGENMARIEVLPEALVLLLQHREMIVAKFREIGFHYVTMDLTGYRTGSMNETIQLENKE